MTLAGTFYTPTAGLVTEKIICNIWNKDTFLRRSQNSKHLMEEDFPAICVNGHSNREF